MPPPDRHRPSGGPVHSFAGVFFLALLPTFLLAAGGCRERAALPSALDLAGEYSRAHEVFVFHGNEPVQVAVADRLALEATETGRLRFRLHLFAIGGGECDIDGVAVPRRDFFQFETPDRSCSLRIEFSQAAIVVLDVDSRCSEKYCGGDAAIGSTVFQRAGG